MLSGRLNRRYIGVIAGFFITLSICLYYQSETALRNASKHSTTPHATLPCSLIPGANDTVVILKTGSTELDTKLPVHLKTTLNCYPNHLIFSDHAETYHDHTILDALSSVSEIFKTSHEDFTLYRQLLKSGRASLSSTANHLNSQDGTKGKPTNPSWVLDKWKFLPMLHTTLETFPNKNWYIFVETDTYILWSNLLSYLSALDSTKKYYIGSQNEIDTTIYAHGGSGFAISRPALEAVVALYIENKDYWEELTANHWAGDAVLGKALFDSGTNLTWAWPIWQGNDVGNMSYGRVDFGKRLWCYPSVSYHHLGPGAIEDLWRFEQGQFARIGEGRGRVLRHRDVFAEFVLPRTGEERWEWDNHADEDRGLVDSLDECRGICEKEDSCLQYAYDQDGSCKVTTRPNLGEASPGLQSGWIQERIKRFHDEAEPCGDEEWIV